MGLNDGLSNMQKKAVESIDDDLEIIACAGAGKTGVVTRRIINILKSKPDILPENIVAFTFTRIGSRARRTLIQLCGYLGFMKLLLSENKYPIIPFLVIDHISQPFDDETVRAIGQIINTAIEEIGKDNLQIIMFDEKEYQTLAIKPSHSENLVWEKKTGFNPFYYATNAKSDETVNEIDKN